MKLLAVAFVALGLLLSILVAFGLGALARRAGRGERTSARVRFGTFAAIGSWLIFTLVLARAGFFRAFESIPPRIPLSAITVLVAVSILMRTKVAARLLDAMPPWWPIALQAFRIPVELLLWGLHERGAIPVEMTFEGRNFDILVGLSAPFVAYAVYRRKIGRLGVAVWNFGSLALLANIVGIAITSVPGPLHLEWNGVAPVVVADPPFVWLPSFLVPLAALGHVASLRSALRGRLGETRTDSGLSRPTPG